MAYDAITIDTNMAIQGGLNLEAGLLGQLTQFKDGQVDVVLSEIVTREIHKHLVQQVKKARDSFVNAAARAEEVQLTSGEAAAALKAQAAALDQPRAVAGARLTRYLEATGAEQVPANLASMDAVVRGYFSSSAPFEAAGAKKSEFPDAIALLSIEAWAKRSGKKVLAVSEDGGWRAFGEKSEYIDVETDFATALEILQEHADAAEKALAALLVGVEAGEHPDLAGDIESHLSRSLSEWRFTAEGGGSFYLEVDSVELELGSFAFEKVGEEYDITVVRIGSNLVAARIGVTIAATARADFSLAAWDSVDKEYMDMGGQSAERDVEFEGAILLTLVGDIADAPGDMEVEKIEVVEAVETIDFGEIEFDHDDEDYEAWLAEDGDADVAADVQQDNDAVADSVPF